MVPLGTEGAAPAAALPLDLMQLIQVGVLAVVALILGLFVVRPILAPSRLLPPPAPVPAVGGDIDTIVKQSQIEGGADKVTILDKPEDPVQRLRQMIAERETETIQILQDWIEEPTVKEQV